MQARRSPTLELAKTLGLELIGPAPRCDALMFHDHRPAVSVVLVEIPTHPGNPLEVRACVQCEGNYRAQAREGELTIEVHPIGAAPDPTPELPLA